jgi:two-component system nitrogen regulation response regulator GlnG
MDQGKILVTEDEESLRFVLQKALEGEGYWVQTAANGATARRLLSESHFDVSLMDIKLPDADGLTLLKEFKDNGVDTAMILMTAQNTMRNAIGAMKNGAFDYITKPFDLDEVLVLIKRAMDSRKLTRDFRELKEEVKKRFEPGVNIIGTSAAMQGVYKTIGQVVDNTATILILGESGTGKELVAKTIHYNSPRWNQPFIAINCAAIPRDLLESELFGHEKGSFTGAMDRRLGKFELAEGGTLFLDEVADIFRRSSCAFFRITNTAASAAAIFSKLTCASSPPPIKTSKSPSKKNASAKTCISDLKSSPSICHRCASGAATSAF